jgi:LysR family glycine cleavage system transcriptional activator
MPSADASQFITDPGISWSQLRAFQACLSLKSFTSAGAALSLTPAAVRHQVGLLESRFGAPLFLRESGRLKVTTIGTNFAREIDRPMRMIATACLNAGSSARAEPITLTASPLFARRFLLGRSFLRWCGDNGILLDITDEKRELGASVAAIRLGGESRSDVVSTPVLSVRLALAASPMIAASASLRDPRWWSDQTVLNPTIGAPAWTVLWRSLGLGDVHPRQSLQFTSYSAALEAARAGGGLVLAPLPLCDPDVGSRRLILLADVPTAIPIGFALLMQKSLAAKPKARALRRRVLAAVAPAA